MGPWRRSPGTLGAGPPGPAGALAGEAGGRAAWETAYGSLDQFLNIFLYKIHCFVINEYLDHEFQTVGQARL